MGLVTVLTVQSLFDGVRIQRESIFTLSTWRRYLSIVRHSFNFYESLPVPGTK